MTGGIALFAGKKPAAAPHAAASQQAGEKQPPPEEFGFGDFGGYGNEDFFGGGFAHDENFGSGFQGDFFEGKGGDVFGSEAGGGMVDDTMTRAGALTGSTAVSFFSGIDIGCHWKGYLNVDRNA